MRSGSRGIGIAAVSTVLLFSNLQLRADQWQFIKAFPDTSVTQGNTVHGLAVDPEGKLWVQFWYSMPGDSVQEASGTKTPVRAIYIFDKDGNNVSFSPITILTGAGFHDTLFVTPTGRAVTNRGLARDHQGNILASVFDALYRIDYKTGTVLKKAQPFPGIALTAPAVDDNGDIVIGTVLPGNPLKIFDKDFNYLGNVTDVANGYSRSMAVSKDGKDVYYAGYTLHAVLRYHSTNGVLGPYVLADTILKGFDCESFARHPKTNYIWASAGSGNDLPNRYPGVYTNWTPQTWYAYDPIAKQVVDTIMWMNLTDTYNTRPRAMAFSSAGDTAYVGSFGLPSQYWWYRPVQMFVHFGPFEMVANIVVPDTVKFATVFLGYSDTIIVSMLNNGKDTLRISNMTLDNPEFGIVGPTSFTLAQGLARKVGVAVTPTSLGPKQATLTILSNAVDSVKQVRFVGVAAAPPLIAVTPDSLTFVVNEGDSASQPLSIQNSGTGALEWNITFQSANTTASTNFSLGDGAANISAPRDKFVLSSMFSAGGMVGQVPSLPNVVPNNPTRDASRDIRRMTVSPEEGGSIGKFVSSVSSQVIPAVGLPFFDGFESGNFNRWQIDGQSGVREVTNATAAEGAYSFHFQSTLSRGHNQGIHSDFASGSKPEYISFYVRPGSTSSANAYCVFHSDTLGLEAIWFFARSGHFYINGNVGGDESYSYNALQWYLIEFRNIDWVLKNFDYYVNGVLIKADIPFRNANAVNQLQRLYLYNYDIADAWWDNINVGSINWLSVSPRSGTIQPGNTTIVEAKINTANLGSGDFRGLINVNNNDPQSRVKKIPVTIHVVPAPHLEVPDSIEFKSTTYVGVPDTFRVELRNTGSEHLIVFNLTSTNPEFSILGNTLFAVPSLTSRSVPVRFNPGFPGVKTATLTITSNDPDSVHQIHLSALAAYPPAMVVTPESLSAALNVGDSLSSQIHISNSAGLGQLSFSVVTQEILVSPPPGAPLRPSQTVSSREEIAAWPFPRNSVLAENRSSLPEQKKTRITVPSKRASFLPLLVKDKIGDGGAADIDEIRGSVSNGKLNIGFAFAQGVKLDSVVGGLYLDIDRNAATGRHSTQYFNGLGVEYYVFYYGKLFSLGDSIRVTDTNGTMKGVPYQLNGQDIQFSVPLSMLGNDDGAMDIVGISGNLFNATDWAPDTGHVTILPIPSWLTIQPDSGVVAPGGATDIIAKVSTAKMVGGQYTASILVAGNDPKMPYKNVPFILKLTGTPKIAISTDTIDFGKTYLGYKSTNSISINSVGSDKLIGTITTDNPRFKALDSAFSISPGASKSMGLQFIPSATGTLTAMMTITSNADTLPKHIVLRGEGLVAPNIKTDSTSFKFAGGNRDTLSSSLKVINTGGSDLVVKISDEEGSGAAFIYAATYNEIHKIDVSLKRIVQTITLPFFASSYEGLAYSGNELYVNSYSQIYVLNAKDGTTLRILSDTTFMQIDGLAFVNNKLYALHPYLNKIYVLNPLNGAVTGILNLPFSARGGLDGANGRLFASGYNAVYEINPVDGSLIRTLQINGNDYFYGLAFTGSRLFLSNSWYPSKIFEIDPLTGIRQDSISFSSYQYWALGAGRPADAPWLTENPSTVTVPAGDTMVVKIKIAPAGLARGSYQAIIILSSNDPDSARVAIPLTFNLVTGIEEENTLPLVFALYQNYPNPFNPLTTIKFGIPEASKVSLTLYDVLGREVTTIVDKEVQPGYYAIPFNGANLASGAYFYRIIATKIRDQGQTFVETKKLLLMK